MSLNNQANIQSDMDQRAEALASIAEAVRLRRALADVNHDAFLPDLAMSLNNQATMQSILGQRAEALASISEAVRHYRALADANPDAFLPDLARSLSVLGDCLAALDRVSEARDAAAQSLLYLAPFVQRFPKVFDGLARVTIKNYWDRTQQLGAKPDLDLLNVYMKLLESGESND